MLNFFFYLTMILFLVICMFLMLLVLIQKGRGGGLASAFGGSGGNTAFGSKTGDVLTWATSIVFGVFLLLSVAANLFATATHNQRQTLPAAPVPAATPGSPLGANDAVVPQDRPSNPTAPPSASPPPTASDPLPPAPGQTRNP